jgi:hypothetical protein
MLNIFESQKEEIARISRNSQSIAQDRRFLKLSKMRKGESIVVKLVGGWGKDVRPPFGDTTKTEGDQTYFEYEFMVVQGVGEIEASTSYIAVWDAPKTYFRKLDPLMRMGHRVFTITRTHYKGEKDQHGNILNVANYEILAADKADPRLAISTEPAMEQQPTDAEVEAMLQEQGPF